MLLCLLWTGSTDVYGQKARQRRMGVRVDSLALKQQAITDSLATDSITTDSLAILNQKEIEKLEAPVDTTLLAKKKRLHTERTSNGKEKIYSQFEPCYMVGFDYPGRRTDLQ